MSKAGRARRVSTRQDKAGRARRGSARTGVERQAGFVKAGLGAMGFGRHGAGRRGATWRVESGLGAVGQGRHGTASLGPSGFGWARRCVARPGLAGRASFVRVSLGQFRCGAAGQAWSVGLWAGVSSLGGAGAA